MDTTKLLPIGQFAQAVGLTVTALRHYDTTGVLPPAHVDPDTGYRWYRRDQVRTAQLIRGLRQAEVPVERVRELVGADAVELAAALGAHLRDAERRLELQRAVVHSLWERISEGVDMDQHRVTVRQSDAERVLVRAATVDDHGLDTFLRTAYQELYTIAGRGPLTFTGPAFVRFHGLCDDENATLVEACLPFWADGAQPAEADLPEGTYVKDLPENSAACVEVAGEAAAFPAILTAYDSAASWVTDHGFAFAGPVRMIHRRWAGVVGHPDNRVEIAWPFEEAAGEGEGASR